MNEEVAVGDWAIIDILIINYFEKYQLKTKLNRKWIDRLRRNIFY